MLFYERSQKCNDPEMDGGQICDAGNVDKSSGTLAKTKKRLQRDRYHA